MGHLVDEALKDTLPWPAILEQECTSYTQLIAVRQENGFTHLRICMMACQAWSGDQYNFGLVLAAIYRGCLGCPDLLVARQWIGPLMTLQIRCARSTLQ